MLSIKHNSHEPCPEKAKSSHHQPLFALIDCNNFYASCERVFNPKLMSKPLVVLSNNDGCIIARSKEAKLLGIPMGAPAFQYASFFNKHQVIVRSSNFALYGDMSYRVMQTIGHFSPEMQIYSIDEAFLLIDTLKAYEFCQDIKRTVLQWTGIPVSIGLSHTKTLAKAANHIAKKNADAGGVFALDTPNLREAILKEFPVEDVWGIGRQTMEFLHRCNIKYAWDFARIDDGWIKKRLGISALRTAWELRGISCLELDSASPSKKSITCSRSFSSLVTSLEDLCEAISTYTARAAEKLRSQGSLAACLEVFLTTSPHAAETFYSNKVYIKLPQPSAFTPQLISYAKQGLRSIYRPQQLYKKTGIILYGLVSKDCFQQDLFVKQDLCLKKQDLVMHLMDKANKRFRKNIIKFAAEGTSQSWKTKQENCSPCYTTRWEDLLTVKI